MPTPPKKKTGQRAPRQPHHPAANASAAGLLGIGTFLLLFAQLYKLQIKQHDELKTLAVRQQTLRTTVEASRGTIYDKNGDILASLLHGGERLRLLSTSPKTSRIKT